MESSRTTTSLTRERVLKLLRLEAGSLRQMGVRQLGLFGSFARGDSTASSDVDILVQLEDARFTTYMNVKLHLEQLLGRKVDLCEVEAMKPRILSNIQSDIVYVEGFEGLS